ncbi:hypothetical protein HYT23_01265 [Candidatus Pacearchaeota archaeon]|nr:hypothetical protein [Candidatus Pacearchaeota archaeon]
MAPKLGLGTLTLFLVPWYIFNGPSEEQKRPKQYSLPDEIVVAETSLPFDTRERAIILDDSVRGMAWQETRLEKVVKTENIDFSKNFEIKTERYRFVKDNDWLPSRLVGHTLSIPGKLLFWDLDYAWGQDAERTRASLAMLENNPDIKDITLRINHNEAFYDMWRLFTENKLTERNNILARILMGIPSALGNEIWAEFSRGSYYNALTKTAVCYSNIESITAHELGHHKDFSRFTSDWEYCLFRALPPVMLYQEFVASKKAQNEILDKRDGWQFNRYLIPAFATYLLAAYNILNRLLGKKKK